MFHTILLPKRTLMPYTISAKQNGKSRFLLDIPDATLVSNLSVTDVSASFTHFTFSGYENSIVPEPGGACRLLVTMLTTQPAGVLPTAGAIRVRLDYVDLSGQAHTSWDSPSQAVYYVTNEVLTDLDWSSQPQELRASAGEDEVLIIPVTGLCSVKSGVMTSLDNDTWHISASGQMLTYLWTKVTYQSPGNAVANTRPKFTGKLSVVLTAEDDDTYPCRDFLVEIFHPGPGGGGGN